MLKYILKFIPALTALIFASQSQATEANFQVNYGQLNASELSGHTIQSEVYLAQQLWSKEKNIISGFAGIVNEDLFSHRKTTRSILVHGSSLSMNFGISWLHHLTEDTELFSELGSGAGLTDLYLQNSNSMEYKTQEIDANSMYSGRASFGVRYHIEEEFYIQPFIRSEYRNISLKSGQNNLEGEFYDGTTLNLSTPSDQTSLVDNLDQIEFWQMAIGIGIGFNF